MFLIKDYLIVFGIAVTKSKRAKDNIRNKIGSNSEKEFNNSKFLNDSEVENKPSTPPILREGLVKIPKGWSLISPFLFPFPIQPLWALTRTEEELLTRKERKNMIETRASVSRRSADGSRV
jgi:hypothetical protein